MLVFKQLFTFFKVCCSIDYCAKLGELFIVFSIVKGHCGIFKWASGKINGRRTWMYKWVAKEDSEESDGQDTTAILMKTLLIIMTLLIKLINARLL